MSRQVKCECGYVARAETENEVVVKIRDHMRADHPELLDKVKDDDIRGWVEIVA